MSLKKHLPEESHNRWPKHVGDYTFHNTIYLHIYIYALVGHTSYNESSSMIMNDLKLICTNLII